MSQPVYIVRQEKQVEKSAFSHNLVAIQAIAELIKTTFGPKSMQKLLFDKSGSAPTVTNDAAKILEEIEISHPGGKIILKQAKAHKKEIGDGTTRLILFSAALMTEANELINQGYHPRIVHNGFKKSIDFAVKALSEMAHKFDINDNAILKNIASTTLASRNIPSSIREKFAAILVDAVNFVKQKFGTRVLVDLDDIQTVRKMGDDSGSTELIKGLVIDKELLHIMMPSEVHNAKIAIIDAALEIVKTNFDAQVQIQNSKDIQSFKDKEANILKGLVESIIKAGANVVFCQKGIDEGAQRFLYQNGIFAVRRVKKSDMFRIAKATGGNVINDIKSISPSDLGHADLVIERKLGNDRLVFIEGCKDPKSVSILIRGFKFTESEADEAIKNALNSLRLTIENPYYIAGGGAVFSELAERVSNFAKTLSTKEQMVAEAYAAALERIPLILAENGGLNILDLKSELYAAHKKPEGLNFGVDFEKKGVSDMVSKGIIEPLEVTMQVIKAATELTNTLLNVDEMIDKKGFMKGK